MEPVVGFEPTTDGLQNRCSTTELNWPPAEVNDVLSGRLSQGEMEKPIWLALLRWGGLRFAA
jgi:uncharacterized protein YgfB (UPF0149 family)